MSEHRLPKMKPTCSKCAYFNYDFLADRYESGSFCGLHGRSFIEDPDAPPPPLGHEPNDRRYDCHCGFWPKGYIGAYQLELFDWDALEYQD